MKRLLGLSILVLAARFLGAEGPPAVAGLEPLFDNGRTFSTAQHRLPLHCLDLPGLLALDGEHCDQALDKAAAAGFNAVSFEAPLFGPQGMCPSLGHMDPNATQALTQTLAACGLHRLYAFPVLYPPAGVDGLIGTATAHAVFFAGRHSWGWQCWALRQIAALKVGSVPLPQTPVVGGWILYRGAWPGGPPLVSGTAQALSPSAASVDLARLRLWSASTVQFARKLGFRQELGIGLWTRDDLAASTAAPDAAGPVSATELDASAAGPPPMEAPSETVFSAQDLDKQSQAADVLPPVAGADADALKMDDSSVVPAAPGNPWELEGLDWTAVESLFTGLPMASQLNFVEVTLDTEDWYGVGTRLAKAADKAEVPVLWRQDWRSASRYERGKHLDAPAPLAGLDGPWPDDDWPTDGALWPVEPSGPETESFRVQSLRLKHKGDTLVLEVGLSRPAELTVDWGRSLPLDQQTVALDGPGVMRKVTLTGVPPGAWFLLKLKAESARFGVCLLRTRWVRAPL